MGKELTLHEMNDRYPSSTPANKMKKWFTKLITSAKIDQSVFYAEDKYPSIPINGKQYEIYLRGKLGIIIDGTGASPNALAKKKTQLESLGYDCYMIFVNTSLETALKRNKERKDRSLLDKIVERAWQQVQNAQSVYRGSFGSNYQEVSTENTKEGQLPPGVKSAAHAFINRPIKNREALKWIANAKNIKVM